MIAKCVFCGKEQEDYLGTYLIKNDGTVNYYSSSKCMKNHLKLKRDRRKIKWTETFHTIREKRLEKEKEKVTKAQTKKTLRKSASKMKVEKKEIKK